MKRRIRMYSFDTIFQDIQHLNIEEDHQALLAMMIKFANDNSKTENWSWLNFATILYATRKNAGTKRWFYNTKDGQKLTKEQLLPYFNQILEWQKAGWIRLSNERYTGALSKGTNWSPLPTPKPGDTTYKYYVNVAAIEGFGSLPTTELF